MELKSTQVRPGTVPVPNEVQLREKAREMEAAFLAEMLKHAGVGEVKSEFGTGGPGEEQFASFLRHEQAKSMVEGGGIGLAETIFNALVAQEAKNEV